MFRRYAPCAIHSLALVLLLALSACQPASHELTPAQIALLQLQGFQPCDDGWTFGLDDKVLFGSNESVLTPAANQIVGNIGRALVSVQIRRVRVDGYTDSYGTPAYNEQLSIKRANTVADALAVTGLARRTIETRGLGDRNPVADNRTASGAAQNRRVAIVVLAEQ